MQLVIFLKNWIVFILRLQSHQPFRLRRLDHLFVLWAVFALYRSTRAAANIIGKYTTKMADELEKRVKK
jgi:hypothetical protein